MHKVLGLDYIYGIIFIKCVIKCNVIESYMNILDMSCKSFKCITYLPKIICLLYFDKVADFKTCLKHYCNMTEACYYFN